MSSELAPPWEEESDEKARPDPEAVRAAVAACLDDSDASWQGCYSEGEVHATYEFDGPEALSDDEERQEATKDEQYQHWIGSTMKGPGKWLPNASVATCFCAVNSWAE